MSIGIIDTHILVESSNAETDEQFCAAIESMILQTYGHRPDWLQFSAGARFIFGKFHFRGMVCLAGSVALMLMQRAKQDGGFSRAIIYKANCDGCRRAFEIRNGVESGPFSQDELRAGSNMIKIPTILLAAIIGAVIEFILCVISVISVLTGGIGPCGPTRDVPGFVSIIHQPGFWISGLLVGDYNLLNLPLAVVFTTVFLSLLAFVVLRFGIRKKQNPSA